MINSFDPRARPPGFVPAPDPRPTEPPDHTASVVCELCGGPVLDRHCKILCLNCGYQRDCSDP